MSQLFKHTLVEIETKRIELSTKTHLNQHEFECTFLSFCVARDLLTKSGTIIQFKKEVTDTFSSFPVYTDVKVFNKLRKFNTYNPFVSNDETGIDVLKSELSELLFPIYKPFVYGYFRKNNHAFNLAKRVYYTATGIDFEDKDYLELSAAELSGLIDNFLKGKLLTYAFAQVTKANCFLVYKGKIYNTTILRSNRQVLEFQAEAITKAIIDGTFISNVGLPWGNQL